jgi:hypothetical protein
MSELKVSIQHGEQNVMFFSPGEENGNSSFSGILSSVTAPVKTIAKVSRKAIGPVSEFASTAARYAGRGAHGLPVIGKPLGAVVEISTAPITLANEIIKGGRVDKVTIQALRKQVKNAVSLAPYAQVVAASVPGVGTGIASAIAAGSVLAEGRSIDEAAIAASRAAIPGGPIAQAAFDAGVAVSTGKSVKDAATSAAISAIAKTPAERAALESSLVITEVVSRGKPIDRIALTAAITSLDPAKQAEIERKIGKPGSVSATYSALTASLSNETKRALASGIALGFAKKRQDDIRESITSSESQAALIAVGKETIAKSEVLRAAQSRVPEVDAFALGIGLMRHSRVPSLAVKYLREIQPKGRHQVSFDSALAIQIGAVKSPPFQPGTSEQYKIGCYAVIGSLTGSKEQRGNIVKLLVKTVDAQKGAADAIREIKKQRSLWKRIIEWLKRRVA